MGLVGLVVRATGRWLVIAQRRREQGASAGEEEKKGEGEGGYLACSGVWRRQGQRWRGGRCFINGCVRKGGQKGMAAMAKDG